MRKIAIDLTWLRHGKVGGTESSVINLLNGFKKLNDRTINFYIITAKDNHNFLQKTFGDDYFKYLKANTICASQPKRVMWQNLGLCRLLKKWNQ